MSIYSECRFPHPCTHTLCNDDLVTGQFHHGHSIKPHTVYKHYCINTSAWPQVLDSTHCQLHPQVPFPVPVTTCHLLFVLTPTGTIVDSAQRVAPPTTAPPTLLATMAPLQESRNNTGTDMDSLSSSDPSLVSLDCPRLLEHVGGAVGGASDPSLPAKMEARVLYSSRSSEVLGELLLLTPVFTRVYRRIAHGGDAP